jgi:hypothetical protein
MESSINVGNSSVAMQMADSQEGFSSLGLVSRVKRKKVSGTVINLHVVISD